MNVLLVASEGVPFSKTGGLADVVGALPAPLVRRGLQVSTVLPFYRPQSLPASGFITLARLRFPFDSRLREAAVLQHREHPQCYLIDLPEYFGRPTMYGCEDDVLRFGAFSRAVVELIRWLDGEGAGPDVIHCHDWQTALVPVYLSLYRDAAVPSVFTIHNLVYQGLAPKGLLPHLGLPWSLFTVRALEYYDQLNLMKGGLMFADVLSTVSSSYAREIQTPEYGAGLEGVLRDRRANLHGIINGLDYTIWNPATDQCLHRNYSAGDAAGKLACKRDLLQEVGLRAANAGTTPLVGMVSRLSAQKGFDLVAGALRSMLNLGCQVIVLGAGDESFVQLFNSLAPDVDGRAVFCLNGHDERLAHKIFAGSDFFLMPSHYEPCGLSQMISLAYGTIPIVRATGGLADTIQEFDPATGHGQGFVFEDYSVTALLDAVRRAFQCYVSPQWPQLVGNAYASKFSWDDAASAYHQLYRAAVAAQIPGASTRPRNISGGSQWPRPGLST